MTDKKQSIRCGNAKEKQTRRGKTFIKLTINLDTLEREFQEHGFQGDHGRMIGITMWPTPDNQYGNSHDVVVDTWKPDPNYQRQQGQAPPPPAPQVRSTPFHTGEATPPQQAPPTPGYEDNAVDDIPF